MYQKSEEAPISHPVSESKEAPIPAAITHESIEEPKTINVPSTIDGAKCAYQYKKVSIKLIDGIDLTNILGQKIRFQKIGDEMNLIVNDQHIGTMGKGRLVEMVEDWLDRDDPIYAVITVVDDDDYTAAFDLFFYRNEFDHLLRKYPHTKSYKLAGNRHSEMQENIDYCSRGDECSVMYDALQDKCLITCGSLDIGYLPIQAATVIDEVGFSNVSIYIDETYTDDKNVNIAKVYLFILE